MSGENVFHAPVFYFSIYKITENSLTFPYNTLVMNLIITWIY